MSNLRLRNQDSLGELDKGFKSLPLSKKKENVNWKKIFIEMTPTEVLTEYYLIAKNKKLIEIKVNEIILSKKEILKEIKKRN